MRRMPASSLAMGSRARRVRGSRYQVGEPRDPPKGGRWNATVLNVDRSERYGNGVLSLTPVASAA
jgi:hypothetical protein